MNTTKKPMAKAINQALDVPSIEELNQIIERAASEEVTPDDLIDLEGSGYIKLNLSELGQASKVIFEDLTRKEAKIKLFDLGWGMSAINRTLQILWETMGEEAFLREFPFEVMEDGTFRLPISVSWKPSEDRSHLTLFGKRVRRAPGKATKEGRKRHDDAKARKEADRTAGARKASSSLVEDAEEYVGMFDRR